MPEPPGDLPTDLPWPDEAAERRARRSGLARALAVLATVVALPIAGYHGFATLLERFTIRSYRPVAATVLDTQVLRSDEAHWGLDGRRVTVTRYIPAVHYEYLIDGEPYASVVVYPFGAAVELAEAEAVVARYRKGQPVVAHYDPREPSNAFLIPRLGARHARGIAWPLGVAVLFWMAFLVARDREAALRSRFQDPGRSGHGPMDLPGPTEVGPTPESVRLPSDRD